MIYLGIGGYAAVGFSAIAAILFVGGFVGLIPASVVVPWLPIMLGMTAAVLILELAFFWYPAILAAIVGFVVVAVVVSTGLTSWGWPL